MSNITNPTLKFTPSITFNSFNIKKIIFNNLLKRMNEALEKAEYYWDMEHLNLEKVDQYLTIADMYQTKMERLIK